jgi:hypothetical protein
VAIAQSVPGAVHSAARDGRATFIILFAAVATIAWHGALPLNHDVAWIWEGAQRLLHGARFGSGVDDVNPPLAWWLTEIPALLSQVTGLSASVSFSAFVAVVGAASILVALRIMAEMPQSYSWLFALFATWALLFMPGYDFGQREQLMTILALPYVCMASRIERDGLSPTLRAVVGVMAGVGFCLKPYFLLIPLLVEVWRWSHVRRLSCIRTETVTLAMAGIGYFLAVVFYAPDYLAFVVPRAMAGYDAYKSPLASVALQLLLELTPVAFGFGLVAMANFPRRVTPLAQSLSVAGLGAAIACLVQSKGWAYQIYPALAFASIAVVAQGLSQKSLIAFVGMAMVLVSGSQNAVAQIMDSDGTRARVAALSAVFEGRSVYAFITSPRDIHPAIVESGAIWHAPACCLYLLPGAVENRSPVAVAVGRRQMQIEISRLSEVAPDIVAIDDSPYKLGFGCRRFDYIAYFKTDPRFARFWRRYREVSRIANFRIFRCSQNCSGDSAKK